MTVQTLDNRIMETINNDIPIRTESWANKDMAVFRPTMIVTGENQFDNYHFLMLRIPAAKMKVDKNQIDIFQGRIFVSNPHQTHEVLAADMGDFEQRPGEPLFTTFFIETTKLLELSKSIFNRSELCFENRNYPLNSNIPLLVRQFIEEHRNRHTGSEFMLECIVNQLALTLVRELGCGRPCRDADRRYSARRDINIAIDFLWEHPERDFSLKELCRLVNLSQYYFLRLFRDHTGSTPHEYYMEIKIRKTIDLLRSGRYSIAEISYLSGFSSHSHFSSAFRKKIGVTPSEFMEYYRGSSG